MRADFTDITFVLDRSGSMASVKQPTIDAFNTFLRSQRAGEGVARMTLIQFDDQYEELYVAQPLGAARELTGETFQPRGNTALLDAMGRAMIATGKRLNAIREAERPGAVLFVTLTDGFENASREFTSRRIQEMIAHQRDKYGWQFIFLGANQDAIATAAQWGIAAGQALTYSHSPQGTVGCMAALDEKVHKMRKARSAGLAEDVEFDEGDRRRSR